MSCSVTLTTSAGSPGRYTLSYTTLFRSPAWQVPFAACTLQPVALASTWVHDWQFAPPGLHDATESVQPRRRELPRSEEHTSELQSRGHLVCRPLLEQQDVLCPKSHVGYG